MKYLCPSFVGRTRSRPWLSPEGPAVRRADESRPDLNKSAPVYAAKQRRELGRRPVVAGFSIKNGFAFFIFVMLTLSFSPTLAVEPSEVLDDPALEGRAREVSKDLRCVVCQNQSIDDSNAELARDMRILVRERLVAGDSNQQVKDYMVSRYGDFVLLDPPFKSSTYVLWFGPALIVGIGILVLFLYYRRRQGPVADVANPKQAALSDEERKRLDALMKDEG